MCIDIDHETRENARYGVSAIAATAAADRIAIFPFRDRACRTSRRWSRSYQKTASLKSLKYPRESSNTRDGDQVFTVNACNERKCTCACVSAWMYEEYFTRSRFSLSMLSSYFFSYRIDILDDMLHILAIRPSIYLYKSAEEQFLKWIAYYFFFVWKGEK